MNDFVATRVGIPMVLFTLARGRRGVRMVVERITLQTATFTKVSGLQTANKGKAGTHIGMAAAMRPIAPLLPRFSTVMCAPIYCHVYCLVYSDLLPCVLQSTAKPNEVSSHAEPAAVMSCYCRTRWGTAPRPRMTTRARAEFIFTLKFIYILISSDDDHDRSAIRGYTHA